MAVLLVTLSIQASAYVLPDNPPTCSLSASDTSVDTTTVLTSTSVDTLTNAGVYYIKIYEDNRHISTKYCGYATTCVGVKTVVHTAGGSHNYHAVCRDKAGQTRTSGTVRVTFAGMNYPPVIDSTTPRSLVTMDEDETTTFRITAHDPDGDVMRYTWSVDGVTVSTGTSSSHRSYDFSDRVSSDTTFTIAVMVSDNNGGHDVAAWHITVRDVAAELAISGDTGLTECDTFTFDAAITTVDPVTGYRWDFGDGTSSAQASPVQHHFADDGTYTVSLTIQEADRDQDTDSMNVNVLDVTPVIDAGPDDTVEEGSDALLSGSASMPCDNDNIMNYTWSFGDGTPDVTNTALVTVNHNYTAEGSYTATFTVCDEDSCVSDSLIVTVEDATPNADFTWTPAAPLEGEQIDFTWNGSSYDPVTFEWDFDNDGTADATTQDASWTFDQDGTYPVCLTLTDSDNDVDTVCHDVVVGTSAPTPVLTLNVTSGDEPLAIHADCSASGGNPSYS
ncbi:PKD domain-containing protein, partial [Nanoarchaeota archaeon]